MSKFGFAAAIAAALISVSSLQLSIAPAAAQTGQPAADAKKAETKKAETKKKAKKPPTPAQLAARERQKKCGAEWKAAKAAGKIQKGMTWPKYWSACNKRLKAGG